LNPSSALQKEFSKKTFGHNVPHTNNKPKQHTHINNQNTKQKLKTHKTRSQESQRAPKTDL
jgi:hypothetical protein